ncbi:M67 family metallopeptidase [Sphingomonas sp.]|uniref:M67 family metallopeptidase n=1 Tax=Sphingomonas sp. TaxID=28214 RepID=UPI0025E73D88|nr:M67 family metallopeptidase [Sphingomonas sp.]
MNVRISTAARQAMLALAAADPTREVCGLLFGTDGVIESVEATRNVAANPCLNFEIDPVALIAALRAERAGGPPVVGYFHSHPNGLSRPSPTDIALAAPDNRLWIILGTTLTAWRSTPSGFVQIVLN